MTTPVPEEVYAAAAKAIHDRECADGTLCTATPTSMRRYAELGQRAAEAVWSLAFAAGRASIHAEWAQSLAADPGPDETGDIRMRADALARQRVEAKVRAEVAAEIRHLLFFAVRSPVDEFTAEGRISVGEWYPADVIDAIVARIAEGKTDTKEEK